MPTAGLSGETAALVALAGGAGAFLGAVVGQVIQWWRDTVNRRVEDKRRDDDRRDAIARERRQRQESYLATVADSLQAISDDLLECLRNALRLNLSDSPGEFSRFMQSWHEAADRISAAYATARKAASLHTSNEVREYLSFFQRFMPSISPPNWEPTEPGFFGYTYIKIEDDDDRALVEVTTGSDDRNQMRRDQLDSYKLMRRTVEWAMEQVRFEAGSTDREPDALPSDPNIKHSYRA